MFHGRTSFECGGSSSPPPDAGSKVRPTCRSLAAEDRSVAGPAANRLASDMESRAAIRVVPSRRGTTARWVDPMTEANGNAALAFRRRASGRMRRFRRRVDPPEFHSLTPRGPATRFRFRPRACGLARTSAIVEARVSHPYSGASAQELRMHALGVRYYENIRKRGQHAAGATGPAGEGHACLLWRRSSSSIPAAA
jgi:hypothetical protein